MIHTNICCEVFLWTKLVWNFVSKNIGSAKLFYSTISETFKILLEHFQGHRGMETIAFVDSVKYWGLALLQGRSRVDWNFAEGTTSKVQGKANCCECPRLIQAWTCVWTCTTRTTKKKTYHFNSIQPDVNPCQLFVVWAPCWNEAKNVYRPGRFNITDDDW